MSNLEKFIYNAKKKRKKDFIRCVIMLILFALFCYFIFYDWFMPIGTLIIGVILFLSFVYTLYKINHIKNKLSDEEKLIFEEELSSLNFDGIDYALTDNYIFDYNKIALIPFNSITAIKKIKTTEFSRNSINIKFKVKIWINNNTYTYISKEKSTSINLNSFTLYYGDLYDYIKQRNPNIEEK